MAKTHPWVTTVPSGSEQASTADDHFRRLRLEIEERMNDIVEDWSADPVVLSPTGGLVGKVVNIHSSAFVCEPSEEATVEYGDTGVTVSNLVGPIRAGLVLPLGVTVRRMRWLITNGDTAAIAMKLGSVDFAVGAASGTIASMTTTDSGSQIVDSFTVAPFSYTVDSGVILYLSADKGGGAEFIIHGVSLTYDTPDARNTL
jgi:hypothetical protein